MNEDQQTIEITGAPVLESRVEPAPPIFDIARNLTPLVTTLRWATLAMGLILVGAEIDALSRVGIAAVAAVVALTLWRTLRPVDVSNGGGSFALDIGLDVPVLTFAIVATGAFESPFVLTLVPVIFLAAYKAGYVWGTLTMLPALAAIGIAQAINGTRDDSGNFIAQAGLLYVVCVALGGFSRSVQASADERARVFEMERTRVDVEADRMSAANDLLLALYDVTRDLSVSLDTSEVIASAQRRLRDMFDYSTAVIVVRDDSDGSFRPELSEGTRLPMTIAQDQLPWDLAVAAEADGPRFARDLVNGKRTGCSPYSRSALYAPLRTSSGLVGMIALEHSEPGHFIEADLRILDEVSKPLALALDNARWFGKLRSMGAEVERARIARDLHDRFAQSLAYVGFELERLSVAADADPRGNALLDLREVVRELVAELRDLLTELRAGVDDVTSLTEALSDRAKRFADRTNLAVHLTVPAAGTRLDVRVEQELWRILNEALANVERHANANDVWITWTIQDHTGVLSVRDDGRGFRPDTVSRNRFGLVGIRERAATIGADVSILSRTGAGTEVTVRVATPLHQENP